MTRIFQSSKIKMAVFNCNLCPQTFNRKSNFDRHLGTVHGENNFKCDQCDQTFSRDDKLKRHIQGNHENKILNVRYVISLPQVIITSGLIPHFDLNSNYLEMKKGTFLI